MRDKGENNRDLKYRNRGLILKLICTNDGLSRIDLSRITGLTKMTVTNITSELIRQNYIEEGNQDQNSHVGRNPIMLNLSSHAPKVLGIYIGRDRCSAALSDLKLDILQRKTIPLEEGETQESLIQKVFSLADEMISWQNNIIACGLSTMGPLDLDKKMILNPPNFFGIENLPIGSILENRYCIEVMMDNDANGSALAEKLYGKGKEYGNFLYVGIGNGIGSGFMADNLLCPDVSSIVGELGHIVIKFDGERCSCGNRGCLEVYANVPVIEKKLRNITGRELRFEDFCLLYEDPLVDSVFSDMADKIACALVSVANILKIKSVLIGHNGVFLPDKYLKQMEEKVNRDKLSGSYERVKIERSHFGQDAPLMGSLCIVLNRLFHGELLEMLDV